MDIIGIQRGILGLKGQRVNHIRLDEQEQQLVIHCSRDRRRKAVTGQKGTVNRYVRRQVRDMPLFGYPCVIEFELTQVFVSKNERRMERCTPPRHSRSRTSFPQKRHSRKNVIPARTSFPQERHSRESGNPEKANLFEKQPALVILASKQNGTLWQDYQEDIV